MKVGYGQLIINKDTGRASYAGATTKQQWSAAQEVDNKQLIINKGKRAAISHFVRAAHPEQARVAFGRWSAPSAQYDTRQASAPCHELRISDGAGPYAERAAAERTRIKEQARTAKSDPRLRPRERNNCSVMSAHGRRSK